MFPVKLARKQMLEQNHVQTAQTKLLIVRGTNMSRTITPDDAVEDVSLFHDVETLYQVLIIKERLLLRILFSF